VLTQGTASPCRHGVGGGRTDTVDGTFTRASVVLALALAVPASLPAIAHGALSITNPLVADFLAVTLAGSVQTVDAELEAFTVTDTGDTEAWHVTVQATRFSEHDGSSYVSGGKTLPFGSLTMPAPTVTAAGTGPPAIQPGAPWAIDVAAPVKIASAANPLGIGTYEFGRVQLSLVVPPWAYARRYRSELTVSVISGP
jgi:hypothetical protein